MEREKSGFALMFNDAVKKRTRSAEMRGMTITEAREYLIRAWDLIPLGFDFGSPASSSASAGASGDGGGDGGGGGGGNSSTHTAAEAAPCSRPADFDTRVRAFAAACVQRAFFSPALTLTTWHEAGGAMPFDVLSIINKHVAPSPMPTAAKRAKTYQMQAVELRGQVDALKHEVDTLQVALSVAQLEPTQLHRHVEAVRAKAHSDKLAADAAAAEAAKEHTAALKEARRWHAFDVTQLQGEIRGERAEWIDERTELQRIISDLEKKQRRVEAALHAGGKEAERERARLLEQLQRAHELRAWERVRAEEAARRRVEAQRDELKAELASANTELKSRSRARAAEHQELIRMRSRVKELEQKVSSYNMKANHKFYEIDPIAEESEMLRRKIEAQAAESRRQVDEVAAHHVEALEVVQRQLKQAQQEAAELKAIVKPTKQRFFQSGHFSSEVDLAIIRALQLGVSRRKVPNLFLIFARLFGITIPGRMKKVPGPHVNGERTTVKKYVLYSPGATHVKHVSGMMYQLNKLQVGEWLNEHIESEEETSCCYLADAAESQQVDYLGQLLARRVAGKIEIKALDLAALKGKTADDQAEAFRASLFEVAALMEKAGMVDARAAELIRKFLPTCSMNDRASPARAAARKVLGLPDGDNDPTCAEHGLVNVLEEGRKGVQSAV